MLSLFLQPRERRAPRRLGQEGLQQEARESERHLLPLGKNKQPQPRPAQPKSQVSMTGRRAVLQQEPSRTGQSHSRGREPRWDLSKLWWLGSMSLVSRWLRTDWVGDHSKGLSVALGGSSRPGYKRTQHNGFCLVL